MVGDFGIEPNPWANYLQFASVYCAVVGDGQVLEPEGCGVQHFGVVHSHILAIACLQTRHVGEVAGEQLLRKPPYREGGYLLDFPILVQA